MCALTYISFFSFSLFYIANRKVDIHVTHDDGKVAHAEERRMKSKPNWIIEIERDERKTEREREEEAECRREERRKDKKKPEIETVSFATLNYNNTWYHIILLRSNDLTAVRQSIGHHLNAQWEMWNVSRMPFIQWCVEFVFNAIVCTFTSCTKFLWLYAVSNGISAHGCRLVIYLLDLGESRAREREIERNRRSNFKNSEASIDSSTGQWEEL